MDFCEFLAEEELIEIIPNFKFNKQLNLISGDFGPFEPNVPVKVPIWMALNLHQQHKCSLKLPSWIKKLIDLQEQQEVADRMLEMPSEYYREIIKLLQQHVPSIPDCADLIERREAFLKTSIASLFQHVYEEYKDNLAVSTVTLHNVTKAELYLIKNFVQKAFTLFQQLRTTAASIKH
ncbi:DNA replication complex GINS protein PSF2-like [Panonychus citri]|uniref:DNA replication complex GINS protein PSF2-like n=1 Tax=Panonychus citri TaxID=50023 RepID=UPI002306EFDC|nr:DNA replication complex GINS protein PSF2-like [Panonychus citri]XP_053204345.1 DNA replication complex GINS protein PSF2-like [Panonychus citri]XP_053204346.1 DNA replication complex GINS protein PSF2-like [Panonychus citri]